MELGKKVQTAVLTATVLFGGMALAGCNDDVEVLRDPDVKVSKGMTWAWRPMAPPAAATKRSPEGRPVVSRDVIAPPPEQQQHLESNRDWNTEANRKQLKEAIERGLKARGLVQSADPATADFLVDYHVAVKTQTTTVAYPGYPGMACGPFGCWSGWGWGPPGFGYENIRFHEGTFVFDLGLRNPKKLAYRAISHKELNNRTISPYLAEHAVDHLLKDLKPR
ncbi:MAG TPA: DUF4136 domain-containing protein [Candidatus Acidoferrum sp.]|nr:DUF4136 domain-containing protein [Candidatus Acidoferrum sp.]